MKNIFVDYKVSKNCKSLQESYGEICVKCGKCGRRFFNGILANSKASAKIKERKIYEKLNQIRQKS